MIDISEVWAVGARSDSEIYEELKVRVTQMGDEPQLQPLKDVIARMGRLYESTVVSSEPTTRASMPKWLSTALGEQLDLDLGKISTLSEQQGQELLMKYWSSRRED